ncbi:MAG: protein translocase subunit SecF [Acidobacteria bacterium]|nr:MAG: protein translocase subunit SecF [Acidobacteriota bacterium]
MEFFRETDIDFLGKKWYFLTVTMVLFVIGMVALAIHHGPVMGTDFTGGTEMDIKFSQTVPTAKIRSALGAAKLGQVTIEPVGRAGSDEILISSPLSSLNQADLEKSKDDILGILYGVLDVNAQGKQDLNNVGVSSFTAWLMQKDPYGYIGLGEQAAQTRYQALATELLSTRRDKQYGGLLPSFNALAVAPGSPQIAQQASQSFFLAPFSVRSTSIIGPQVGSQLRGQALRAVLYSLAAMLIYIAFRFEFIYGLAAVVAVFHDVLITLGMFALVRLPIDLTVVAAFLTLIGYSMNDTIVVFDRVRENLPIMRRDRLPNIVNRSINQTLSRTVLTSGLTFLSVLALLVLGGQALRGFSFCMTFGILVGTYSSIAVAAPMMVAYIEWRNRRQRPLRAAALSGSRSAAPVGRKLEKVGR